MDKSRVYALEQARKRGIQKSICVAELVQVMEFYAEDMTVDVRPLVMDEQEEGYKERPPVLKIPVIMLGSLEIPIRPWYKAGDIGLAVYLDQDSDNVILSGTDSEPQNRGYHTGEHAIFVGAVLCGGTPLEMPGNQTDKALSAGMPGQYVTISEEGMKIRSQKPVIIEGDVHIKGALFVNQIPVPWD